MPQARRRRAAAPSATTSAVSETPDPNGQSWLILPSLPAGCIPLESRATVGLARDTPQYLHRNQRERWLEMRWPNEPS